MTVMKDKNEHRLENISIYDRPRETSYFLEHYRKRKERKNSMARRVGILLIYARVPRSSDP